MNRDILSDLTRRRFLGDVTTGLMGVGLTQLLSREASSAVPSPAGSWTPGCGRPHFPAKAKRVLQIFCPGAASHMDLWEHKPMLEKMDGKPHPGEANLVSFQGKNGPLMRSPWDFQPAGESGKMFSTILPHLSAHVDEIAFFHGMTSKTNTHGPGCVFVNTGHPTEGFPSAGAWVSYGLGSGDPRCSWRTAEWKSELEQRIFVGKTSGHYDGGAPADPESPPTGIHQR